jgi:ribosome modulation factor
MTEAEHRGMRAREMGRPVGDNPYNSVTERAKWSDWRIGWRRANDQNVEVSRWLTR